MFNFIYSIPIYSVQFLVNGVAKNLQIVRRADVRYELRGSLPTNVIREANEPEEGKRGASSTVLLFFR